MVRPIPRRLFLLSAGLAAAALARGDSRIVEDWRLAVVQVGSGTPVSAVCPDGTLFLASRDGTVTAVDRQGRIVFLRRSTGFRTLDALACDAGNALYMAAGAPPTGESLAVLKRGPMGYQTAVVGYLGIAALSMAVVGQNRLSVAGYGARNNFPLHLFTSTGKPIRSFGEDGGPAQDPVLARGILLWHEHTGRLLFLPRKLAEIQIYDGSGNRIEVKGLGPLGPAAWPWESDEIDEIYGAALLPRGALLIQGLTSSARVSLRFLDGDFNPVGSEERNDLGRIAGADTGGGLYFLHGNYAIRAHTQPVRGMPRGEPSVPDKTAGERGSRRRDRIGTMIRHAGFRLPLPIRTLTTSMSLSACLRLLIAAVGGTPLLLALQTPQDGDGESLDAPVESGA